MKYSYEGNEEMTWDIDRNVDMEYGLWIWEMVYRYGR